MKRLIFNIYLSNLSLLNTLFTFNDVNCNILRKNEYSTYSTILVF